MSTKVQKKKTKRLSERKDMMIDFSDAIEMYLRFQEEDPISFKGVTLFCKPFDNIRHRIRVTKQTKNSMVVTYGRPNYEERAFLAQCKKAKTLPRRVWLHYAKKNSPSR